MASANEASARAAKAIDTAGDSVAELERLLAAGIITAKEFAAAIIAIPANKTVTVTTVYTPTHGGGGTTGAPPRGRHTAAEAQAMIAQWEQDNPKPTDVPFDEFIARPEIARLRYEHLSDEERNQRLRRRWRSWNTSAQRNWQANYRDYVNIVNANIIPGAQHGAFVRGSRMGSLVRAGENNRSEVILGADTFAKMSMGGGANGGGKRRYVIQLGEETLATLVLNAQNEPGRRGQGIAVAFVSIKPTIHLGPLDANANIFTSPVPAEHPGRLIYAEIDEAFDVGRPQLPPRQANASIAFRDTRAAYEQRRLQSDYLLVIMDTDDNAAPVERFRGRIRKPRVQDTEHGRIRVDVQAWGLWQRLRRSQADVAVPAITDANGKQAVDAVLDQIPWPTSHRNVPSLPSGADIEYAEWAYAGSPVDGITEALAGINPRSKFYVDAAGVLQVVWLSSDIQAFRAGMIRPDLAYDFSALHVINQVLATALDLTRTTTTRYTSTVAVDLDDDMDTVIFEGTLEGGADNARFALNFRQPNGTYFPYHADVDGHLTATLIPGSASMFRVVASARARSGDYTTVVNFFQIQDTVTSQVASTEAPLVRNLGGVAPTEPRIFPNPGAALPMPAMPRRWPITTCRFGAGPSNSPDLA